MCQRQGVVRLAHTSPVLKRKLGDCGDQFGASQTCPPDNRNTDDFSYTSSPPLSIEISKKRRKTHVRLELPLPASSSEIARLCSADEHFEQPSPVPEANTPGNRTWNQASGFVHPLTSDIKTISEDAPVGLKTIRSHGLIEDSIEGRFPHDDMYRISTRVLQSSSPSSSKESICFPISEPSSSPNFATMRSPHEPHFPVFEKPHSIKGNIMHNRNSLSLFTEMDFFHDQMEERLVRWRPSESQHNAAESFSGLHPYQASENKEYGQKGSILASFMRWFIKDPEPPLSVNYRGPELRDSSQNQTGVRVPLIDNLRLNPNTSESIIPRISVPSSASQMQSPMYYNTPTPSAVPISGLQQKTQLAITSTSTDNQAYENVLENLLDEVGFVCSSCFTGIWRFWVEATSYCHNLSQLS